MEVRLIIQGNQLWKGECHVTALWKNWSNGLHRQTVYGDITKDLQQFCRYEQIKLIDEAAQQA